jgi:ubiquinone/menaquinone biosynthesis C-methylase UbiE
MLKYLSNMHLMPPTPILAILQGSWTIQILKSAVDLGIFEALSAGPLSAAHIAAKNTLQLNGTRLIADSLVGMHLLDRADLNGHARSTEPVYELNLTSQTYLIASSPLFMGMYLKQHEELDKMWRKLRETIKTGVPVMEVNQDAKAEEIFPHLAEAIVPLNYCIAADVVKFLKERSQNETFANVLDLAAGSAVWSIPFAQNSHDTHVAALDFASVLTVTSKITEKFKVADQYTAVAGNWRDVKVSDDLYDIVILGHILHSEGLEQSKSLLRYCCKAMKKGGTLVIAEYMPNQQRTGPLYPLMFGLNMYLATTDGCIFSFEELTALCLDAGFSDVYRHQGVEYDSPVILATK